MTLIESAEIITEVYTSNIFLNQEYIRTIKDKDIKLLAGSIKEKGHLHLYLLRFLEQHPLH